MMKKEDFMFRHPDLYAEIKLEGYQKGFSDGQGKAKEEADRCPLSGFIDECCILDPGARDRAALLYGRFKDWYTEKLFSEKINPDVYEIVPSETWFGRQLGKRFERVKSSGVTFYKGITRK